MSATSDTGLPPGVRYDGPMVLGRNTLLLFTEAETTSTFGLKPADATPAAIAREAEMMRAAFRAARNQKPET